MAIPYRYNPVALHPIRTLKQVCRIYEASIPPSERKPVKAIRAMATRDEYRLIAALRGDTVLGFAATFAPPNESFALLEYLAVDESSRGGGIGAGLFRAAVEALPETSRRASLLVEVEAEVGDGNDREQRRRRQAFYRRLGCRRVAGLAYELPLRTTGEPPPPPMQLMIHQPADAHRLDRRTLEAALRDIYHRVYDQLPDDPRINRMLAGVPDALSLD
jgi:GNAT superfamily N-acetyltransferase